MNKKKLAIAWLALVLLTITTSGCALIGTAISAGIGYGIYKATKK
jgi:uncharacterized protein YceK